VARRKTRARRRPASRAKKGPGLTRRAASATGRHLAARSIDVTAVALIVLALLAVLALWIDSGGPFGTALRAVILGTFGTCSRSRP
jgi:hypothetical protein